MDKLFKKRSDLILDYISQILVYGSDTNGTISLGDHSFDDGKYIILSVNVLKNSYFRWHDLGIRVEDSLDFYNFIYDNILEKFKTFDIQCSNYEIIIFSKVNNNSISFNFTVLKEYQEKWIEIVSKKHYNI